MLLLSITLASSTAVTNQYIFADTTNTASLRTATWADVDEIVTVGFDGFSRGSHSSIHTQTMSSIKIT